MRDRGNGRDASCGLALEGWWWCRTPEVEVQINRCQMKKGTISNFVRDLNWLRFGGLRAQGSGFSVTELGFGVWHLKRQQGVRKCVGLLRTGRHIDICKSEAWDGKGAVSRSFEKEGAGRKGGTGHSLPPWRILYSLDSYSSCGCLVFTDSCDVRCGESTRRV